MTSISVVTASAQPVQAASSGPAQQTAGVAARDVPATGKLNRTPTKIDNTQGAARQLPSDVQRELDRLARSEVGGPQPVRMQIAYDEGSGRVYGQVIDRNTNEVIRQVPSDKLLRLFSLGREQLAMVLDRKV